MIFPEKTEKRIPKTLHECTRTDSTVSDLYLWSERVENWGKILVAILIVVGFLLTIVEVVALIDVNEDMIVPTLITAVVRWGLAAFLTYCAYQVIALLLRALASITHHTMISANVALYENHKAEHKTEDGQQTPIIPVAGKSGKWACPECGNVLPYDVVRCKCGFVRHMGNKENE